MYITPQTVVLQLEAESAQPTPQRCELQPQKGLSPLPVYTKETFPLTKRGSTPFNNDGH